MAGIDLGSDTGANDDAAAALLVEHAGVAVGVVHVGLVSSDDPLIRVIDFAAILDAGVGGFAGEFELGLIFEVGDLAVKDEECIQFDRRLGVGLSGDGAVNDRPERRVAGPTGEVFAVKDRMGRMMVRRGERRGN